MKKRRKILQIAAVPSGAGDAYARGSSAQLFALCADGSLWAAGFLSEDNPEIAWVEVPPPPPVSFPPTGGDAVKDLKKWSRRKAGRR